MVSPSSTPSAGMWEQLAQYPKAQPLPYVVTAFLLLSVILTIGRARSKDNLPIVNPAGRFAISDLGAKMVFIKTGRSLLEKGRAMYGGKPYKVITDCGPYTVVAPSDAEEVRNHPSLSLRKAMYIDYHGHLSGFGVFSAATEESIVKRLAQKQIIKHLGLLTEPVSQEMAHALSLNVGESTEWHEVHIKSALLDIVARISSRVFLGEELCRNEEWLRITKEYTINIFTAAGKLRIFPKFTRPLMQLFVPECKKIRVAYKNAQDLIHPIVAERARARDAAIAAGKPVPVYNDALEWGPQEAKGDPGYTPENLQLGLSMASIHTTTDLVGQAIYDLADNPEYIQPIREEIISVLSTQGWKKSALANMKLLDSALKESQRLKPTGSLTMRRVALDDVPLPSGHTLRKGEQMQVDSYAMMNPDVYADPTRYDAYRFLRMREEAARDNRSDVSLLLVSTSMTHMGFGHGDHACAGRFFAANEVKIALCHFLMKYDFKVAPGSTTKPLVRGVSGILNPSTKLLVRRREKVELDIDSI